MPNPPAPKRTAANSKASHSAKNGPNAKSVVGAVALLAYCRAGFEPDLVAEITQRVGVAPQVVLAPALGAFVHVAYPSAVAKRVEAAASEPLIFARQILIARVEPVGLGLSDRVTPIVDAAVAYCQARSISAVEGIWLEYPDTNDGKSLSKLAGALEMRIAPILAERGFIKANSPWRLHVMLLNKQEAIVACARVDDASHWRLGIPRMRMPHDAPSRSTLKLAEAIHVFLGERDEKMLMPEMRAVDLGAAPGGWTWQLIHRGLHVTAVDNGAMKGELVDNALVRHLREDGFRYRPKKEVDWMVCDMVESPSRIAKLVGQWIGQGWARHCIFNLKLPMKKRLDEVERCSAIILEMAGPLQPRLDLRFKHLYHDREEVTGYCGIIPRAR